MNFRVLAVLLLLVCAAPIRAQSVAGAAPGPRVFFLIGESEYDTKTTVPAFARAELEPRGVQCSFSILPSEDSNDFPDIEALKDADLLFISVRRHAPSEAVMAQIRAHVAAGKSVVGIRTASHAFALRGKAGQPAIVPAGHAVWPEFDHEVLGGNYNDHYTRDIPTMGKIVPEQAQHPVLDGIGPEEFKVPSHLYKNPNLPTWVTPLMTARLVGRPEVEPIAWVNSKDGRRVFYTSLGSPEDFAVPQFRRLLLNGILWALDRSKAAVHPPAAVEKPRAGRTTAAALPPAEAAQSFAVADDLVFEQVLAEPDVEKPVFLNFDERGRMWVVEYRQYPEPAGLKVLSHDIFWRAIYDKVPPPPPHQDKGRDRISIHESTKGDGVFDKHTVFVDGLNICTAVERGRGGVWVMNPPYLLFYPDANNDDIPDGDPVVHLAGFGIEDTHSVANSLRWGPDGWLYGAHGSTVTSHIVRPGRDPKPIADMQGQAIWRYDPASQRFEVFCEGGGNTFGVEMDAKGRIFSGHNGGDTRGFHYMQGAYLRKGFDKHGPLSNPYTFGYFDQMANEKVERFTHNFIIYEGGALPGHAGHLFGVEPMQGRLVESEITPSGSTFRTHDLQRPVVSRDPWFRPVDIKGGPRGSVYICDWYVPQLTHARTYSDLQNGPLDLAHGRIYRLRSTAPRSSPPVDFSRLGTSQLVQGLRDENKWVRQTVQRILVDRTEVDIAPALRRKLLETNDGQYALELLWALHNNGGLDEAAALKTLAHADPFVRMWTTRLMCDDNEVSAAEAAKLVETAEREDNVEVRAQLACSARRLPARDDLAIVRALLNHDEDAADPRVPLLLWWAIEAKADTDREVILAMLRDSPLWERPIVKQHLLERIMRRYAQTGVRKDLLTCATLLNLAPTPEHTKRLMAGFEAAYRGRPMAGLPEELIAAMRRQGVGSIALDLRAGEAGAVGKALQAMADEKAPSQTRLEYVTIFGEVKAPAAVGPLLDLVDRTSDEALRKAALGALATYDDVRIAPKVVAAFPRLGKESQGAACALLSSRAGMASLFLAAVENGSIARTALPLEVVRQIKLFPEQNIPARAEKIWGAAGRPTSAQMTERIQHLATVVREGGEGDPYAGRTVFLGTCGACHALHGQGGAVGPDLTKFKRDDVDSLLLNIVNPNAEIREGYESFLVNTNDGRMVTGFLVEQDPQVVVLRGLDGQNVALPRAEIREMKAAGVSLMPEGLLDTFDEKQVRDLFAYLRTTQPLPGKR